MKTRLTERDITRIVRRVVNEQNGFDAPPPEGKILVKDKNGKERYIDDDGKKELIDSLITSLKSMENRDEYDALMVSQIIYNNCAQWMNKNHFFSSRPGEPTKTKAQFAPEE